MADEERSLSVAAACRWCCTESQPRCRKMYRARLCRSGARWICLRQMTRPSWQQIAMILFCLADAACFGAIACTMVPAGLARCALSIVYSIAFGVMLVAGIRTMVVNPADPCVAVKRAGTSAPGAIAPSGDAIPEFWCGECDSAVVEGSKHCWDCGVCVAKFDHHCVWLNACIGARNYVSFFVSILAFVVNVTVMMVSVVIALASLSQRVAESRPAQSGELIDSTSCRYVLAVLLAANALAWFAIVGLLVFHCYLLVMHMTTYEFLKKRKARAKEKKEAKHFLRDAPSQAAVPASSTAWKGDNGVLSPWLRCWQGSQSNVSSTIASVAGMTGSQGPDVLTKVSAWQKVLVKPKFVQPSSKTVIPDPMC